MLNLKGFTLLKPLLYNLIGIVTKSAWQGHTLGNFCCPKRRIPNINPRPPTGGLSEPPECFLQ